MYWMNIEKIGYISKISDIFDFLEKIMIFSIPALWFVARERNLFLQEKRAENKKLQRRVESVEKALKDMKSKYE